MDFENIFKNSNNGVDTSVLEILRYMGCNDCGDKALVKLAENAKNEVSDALNNHAVWRYIEIKGISADTVDFGFFSLESQALAKHLKNCRYAAFMAATIGNGIDILIKKHSVSSMSYAVAINAAGTSYIESYCDYVCDIIKEQTKGYFPTSRFSPGYAELSIKCQKEIFSYLDATKNTGIHLNESFMMMPSKSVCAIIGLGKRKEENERKCDNKCLSCDNYSCDFRKGTNEK